MAEEIQKKLIEEEMKESYMDYAMSVIVSRALPDARDGLKPVHRRILFAMHQLGLQHNKPFRKSATVVGNVMAKLHPHGDVAIYDTLARMAQNFSLRYPLVDGQGNFGCFTKDTKVALTDGKNLSFGELVDEYKNGRKNYTFTINKKGNVEIAEIKKPRLTKRKEKIIKVVLDNGEEIKCTLDHKFMLRNGGYKKAQHLKPKDSLMPLYLRLSTKKDKAKPSLRGYQMVYQPKANNWLPCHNLADDWNLRNDIYRRSAGRIRHHLDFDKSNNNPDNVRRIRWGDHWRLHAEHASELHKDKSYREKIANGRTKYWTNPANRKKSSKRLSNRNKKNWQNPEYRKHMIKTLSRVNIEFVKNHPESREERSKRLKRLWKDKKYIKKMSALKSKEMKERWKDNDPSLRRFTSEEAKKIWSKPGHREFISKKSKELWQDENYRKRMSNLSKNRWQDEEYKAKFPKDHFSKMSKKMWKDPNMREFHRKKAILQWQNPSFREKIIREVKARNKQRLKEYPDFMKKLATKAKIVLRKKWQDSSYKEKVIKSKIHGYVYSLINKYEAVTPEIYERERSNNGIPRVENALKYFDDFSDIIEQAKKYNHKVVRVEILTRREDVYDVTIEGTHNFALASGVFVHNSIDGDKPSAMRYTESRMAKLAEEILVDIEKETVDFIPNYDASTEEPSVLPSKVPNLLINGSSGIAVGMSTNMAPHNIKEVCDAIIATVENPVINVSELMKFILGPDFPTRGYICGRKGIIDAYTSGRGRLVLRARTNIEEKGDKKRIIVTEIPYQVNKSSMIEHIADLIRDKKIEGIRDIRDESDRKGIRVVFELKKGFDEDITLNQLYHNSQLQTTFGIINIALIDGQPKLMGIKDLIQHYINHRKEVITRRTKFDLTKAEEKAHILEGLKVALQQIDSVIKTIKGSKDAGEAKKQLIERFKLTEKQVQAILDMKLQRLTSLEQDKIKLDYDSTIKLIQKLKDILSSEPKILGMIKKELIDLKSRFGDDRRTEIIEEEEEIDVEDMIPEENVVVTVTHSGYIKKLPVKTYKKQKRGGKGVKGTELKEEDAVEQLFTTSNHNYILFFTNEGKVHWLKAYNIPTASRYSKGKAIVNLLRLGRDEKITALVPVSQFDEKHFLLMATKKGLVKKTPIMEYSRPRKSGIAAIKIREGDELVKVLLTPGILNIVIATKKGMAVKFNEKDVLPIGRTGMGARGIRLKSKSDEVIGMEVALDAGTLLTVTENGYGKRTKLSEYTLIKRGGSGVINIKITGKNGNAVGIKTVKESDEILIITKKGQMIRMPIKDISTTSRITQGVRVIRLSPGDNVTNIARVVAKSEE